MYKQSSQARAVFRLCCIDTILTGAAEDVCAEIA